MMINVCVVVQFFPSLHFVFLKHAIPVIFLLFINLFLHFLTMSLSCFLTTNGCCIQTGQRIYGFQDHCLLLGCICLCVLKT